MGHGIRIMRQAGEPSVEEILESIKKVIARDNRIEAGRIEAAQPRPRAEAQASLPRTHEVLDLTEIAAQILSEEREADDAPEALSDSPLIPETTAASMRDSLAALAMLSEPGAQPQIVRSGETSLEGLVREMLRPMLADWLDKNLPPMVERMVASEIARIVGKKG